MTALSIAAALLTAFAGFGALALSMSRHARDLFGKAPKRRTAWSLRIFGAVSLCAAYAFCVAAWGVSIGPVAWFGMLTAAALTNAVVLAFPSWRRNGD